MDKAIAGMMPMRDMVPDEVPAHWLVYFGVADTDATVAKATELGGSTVVPPTDIPAGNFRRLDRPRWRETFAVINMHSSACHPPSDVAFRSVSCQLTAPSDLRQ